MRRILCSIIWCVHLKLVSPPVGILGTRQCSEP
jgi:hypothetical protein